MKYTIYKRNLTTIYWVKSFYVSELENTSSSIGNYKSKDGARRAAKRYVKKYKEKDPTVQLIIIEED